MSNDSSAASAPTPVLLADPHHLAVKLGLADDDVRLVAALERSSNRFRAATGWQIHQITTSLTESTQRSRTHRLRVRDVVDVIAATLTGTLVAVEWDTDGLIERADGRWWPRTRGGLTVELAYGFDPIPGPIQEAVTDQAEAIYNMIRGLSSKQVGGISTSYGSIEAIGVSQTWTDTVELYRLGGRA